MAIEYYLRENALTPDPDDHNAVVVSKGTANSDELVNMMIQQGSTLTPEDIRATFESLTRATTTLLNQGFGVATPVGTLRPSIKGVFNGREDSYDAKRHTLRLNATPSRALEKRWLASAQLRKTEARNRVAPIPQVYHDIASQSRNGSLTPESAGRVTGQNLKFAADDSQQGVFFIGEDGSQSRAAMYVTCKPKEVIFMIPTLPAGDYTLRVCAKVPGSQDRIRCGTLEHTLTVS